MHKIFIFLLLLLSLVVVFFCLLVLFSCFFLIPFLPNLSIFFCGFHSITGPFLFLIPCPSHRLFMDQSHCLTPQDFHPTPLCIVASSCSSRCTIAVPLTHPRSFSDSFHLFSQIKVLLFSLQPMILIHLLFLYPSFSRHLIYNLSFWSLPQ